MPRGNFDNSLIYRTGSVSNRTDSSTNPNPFSDPLSGYGDYDLQFAANPYRKQTYQMSFWENLANSLGFRTGYDDWLDQTSTQIAEYDAGIFNQMFQNQYNEDTAKASRMRDAGLNPDLLGTGDSSDAATPGLDINGMQPQQSDQFSKVTGLISGFASSLMSSFGTGVQIFKSLSEVKKIQAEINGIAASNADRIVDVIDKIIVGSVPLSAYEKSNNLSGTGDNIDSYVKAVDLSKYGFTGVSLTAAEEAFRDRFDSIKNNADIRKDLYERYGAISDTYKTASEGFIPESQMPSSPDEMFNIQTECMARAARRILELKLTNQEFQESVLTPQEQANEFIEQDIEQTKLATLQDSDFGAAQASNLVTGVESDTFLKQAQRIINEERANMYSVLKVKADSGDTLASAVLHAMVLQDLMQVDFGAEVDWSTMKTFSAAAEGLFKFGRFGVNGSLGAKGAFEKALGKHMKIHMGVKSK